MDWFPGSSRFRKPSKLGNRMEEIWQSHPGWLPDCWTIKRYYWWKKSCTSWYSKYLIIYRVLYKPGGCFGFLPSTGINRYSTKLQTFLVQLWSYVRELRLIDMGRIFKVKSFVIRYPEPTGNVGCDIIGRCCKLFTQTVKQTEHNILEGDPHVWSSLLWLFLQHSCGKWHQLLGKR